MLGYLSWKLGADHINRRHDAPLQGHTFVTISINKAAGVLSSGLFAVSLSFHDKIFNFFVEGV